MRITRDLLLSTAKDTVERETFGSNDIVCAYLTGSITHEDPLIGGTTDIDLIYVHSLEVPHKREIIPITDDFHLDIAHFSQSFFSQPRKLRTDAWVGSFFCHYPIVLHDPNHWFDYVRSGIFSQFFHPVNVIQRARPFIETARQGWIALPNQQNSADWDYVHPYLRIIKNAANAIACLTSVPLTDRRFLIDFPQAAREINMPGLEGGLIDLIVPANPIEPNWEIWMKSWNIAFSSLQQKDTLPLSYCSCRHSYYEKAILSLKEDNNQAALWLLLWTWSLMASLLPRNNSSQKEYQDFLVQLTLDGDRFSERLEGLDRFLDAVEASIEGWQAEAGI
ncbi:MAG: hypothetical protein J7K66_05535 [Anaerolineaceae bacterium]|nr:hypothetical protein [Anaerolineaceae bacterium]